MNDLKDIKKFSPKEAKDKELQNDFRLLLAMWCQKKKKKDVKASWEEILNALRLTIAELSKRKISTFHVKRMVPCSQEAFKKAISKDFPKGVKVPIADTDYDGIYLMAPHSKLIVEGKKKAILKAKNFSKEFEKLLYFFDKDNIYGLIKIGKPKEISREDALKDQKKHMVTKAEMCYDEKTRIFTKEGLKKFDEVTKDDLVLSLGWRNSERQNKYIANWRKVKNMFIYPKKERKMIQINCPRAANLLVTPEHQMMTLKRYKPKKAKELRDASCYRLPVSSARQSGKRVPKKINGYSPSSLMELIGWYLAEGCIDNFKAVTRPHKNGQKRLRICIHQDEEDELSKVLSSLNLQYTPYQQKDEKGIVLQIFNQKIIEFLEQFGNKRSEKRIPEWIFNLHHSLQRTILVSWARGDGQRLAVEDYLRGKRNSFNICCIDGPLWNSLVELAIRCGFRVNFGGKKSNIEKYPNCYVYLTDTRYTIVPRKNISEESYDGKVWCLEVDGPSNFLVERNGKFSFSGNSKWWPNKDKLFISNVKVVKLWDRPVSFDLPKGTQTFLKHDKLYPFLRKVKKLVDAMPVKSSGEVAGDKILLADVLQYFNHVIKEKEDFITLTGGIANRGESVNDLDIVIRKRKPSDNRDDVGFKFRIGRGLPSEMADRLHWMYDTYRGNFTNHIHLMDRYLIPSSVPIEELDKLVQKYPLRPKVHLMSNLENIDTDTLKKYHKKLHTEVSSE